MAFAILLVLIAALGLAEHAVGGLGLALSLVMLALVRPPRKAARVDPGRVAEAVARARRERASRQDSPAPEPPRHLVLGEVCGAPRSGCACRRKRPAEDGSPPYHAACDCREAVQ